MSFLKRVFFVCAKRVRPIIGVANNSREKFYNFTCSSHRISVLVGLRQDFVMRKLVRKLRINIQAALRRFRKICCLNQSEVYPSGIVETIVSTFLHSEVIIAVGRRFPSYLDHYLNKKAFVWKWIERESVTSSYHGIWELIFLHCRTMEDVWPTTLLLSAITHRKVIHVIFFFIFLFFRKRNLRGSPVKVLSPTLFSKFPLC